MAKFKIGPPDSDLPGRPSSRIRPPPDFTRRSIKMRIFALLACLFVVLALAERAADPRTWHWLTKMDEQSQPQPTVQNRLPVQVARTEHDPVGTFVTSNNSGEDDASSDDDTNGVGSSATQPNPADARLDPVERAWNQGWRDLLRTLEPPQRELVFRWLIAGQTGNAVPEEIREPSSELVELLDTRWNDYHAAAFQSVQNLSMDDRVLWVDVLRQVNGRWSGEVKPALDSIIAGEKPEAKEQAAIGGLEQTLRRLTLDQVQDDTVFRSAERDIWFHLIAQLKEMPNDQLGARAPEDALYLQLFKQSGDYRGRLVRIKGVAKLGYRIDAPKNYLGIKEYNVLVIHPAGGPDSPIIAYCLDLPTGFPKINHRDKDGGGTKLHEDVAVTGYYFKRWAYQAAGGMYTTPLLIVREPDWKPRPSLAEATGRTAWTPAQIAGTVAVSALGAMLVMTFIVWRIRRDTSESLTHTFNDPAENPSFKGLDVNPAPRDALADLSRQAMSKTPAADAASQERDL